MSLRAGFSVYQRSPLAVLLSAAVLAALIAAPLGLFLVRDEARPRDPAPPPMKRPAPAPR
ncbi:MAG: hypothetical protein AB7N76_21175 [Planctomycetota bacterium]